MALSEIRNDIPYLDIFVNAKMAFLNIQLAEKKQFEHFLNA